MATKRPIQEEAVDDGEPEPKRDCNPDDVAEQGPAEPKPVLEKAEPPEEIVENITEKSDDESEEWNTGDEEDSQLKEERRVDDVSSSQVENSELMKDKSVDDVSSFPVVDVEDLESVNSNGWEDADMTMGSVSAPSTQLSINSESEIGASEPDTSVAVESATLQEMPYDEPADPSKNPPSPAVASSVDGTQQKAFPMSKLDATVSESADLEEVHDESADKSMGGGSSPTESNINSELQVAISVADASVTKSSALQEMPDKSADPSKNPPGPAVASSVDVTQEKAFSMSKLDTTVSESAGLEEKHDESADMTMGGVSSPSEVSNINSEFQVGVSVADASVTKSSALQEVPDESDVLSKNPPDSAVASSSADLSKNVSDSVVSSSADLSKNIPDSVAPSSADLLKNILDSIVSPSADLMTQVTAVPGKSVAEKSAELPAEAEIDVVECLAAANLKAGDISLETVNALLNQGRPTPDLDKEESEAGEVICISKIAYPKIPWLTGSKNLGAHFCWPCLLFSTEEKWSLSKDVGWRASTMEFLKHQVSPGHDAACRTFKRRVGSLNTPEHNHSENIVRENRRFLELLIRILCSKKTKPKNADMDFDGYEELMNIAISHDPELKSYFKKRFNEDGLVDFVSSHAGKLLASIEHAVGASIRKQVTAVRHMLVIYEDTANVVDKASLVAVIVRYVDEEGKIVERFLKLIKLAGPRTASTLYKIHSTLAQDFDIAKKGIGFFYSGTIVTPHDVTKLNSMISKQYRAEYYQCPSYNFKEVLLQSLSHLELSRVFFFIVNDMVEFFRANAGAIPSLVNLVNMTSQCPFSFTSNSFTHDMISTMENIYPQLVRFFEKVSEKFWDDEVVRQAPSFVRFLRDPKNKFLILVVSAILQCTEELSSVVESNSDSSVWSKRASTALSKLEQMKKDGAMSFMYMASNPTLKNDGSHPVHPELLGGLCVQLFDDIIDAAVNSIRYRAVKSDTFYVGKRASKFDDVINDQALRDRYLKTSSNRSLNAQIDSFKPYQPMFAEKTIPEHVKLMTSLGMVQHFPVLYDFLRFSILVARPEPKSSTMVSKLKLYVKDKYKMSSADLLLYLENETVWKLMEDKQFFDDVIDHYAKTNNEPVFLYKPGYTHITNFLK